MSEPAGGEGIPDVESSPPEAEPTNELETHKIEEVSRPSEQPSASLSTPEPQPVDRAVEEIPKRSTFSEPVEAEAPAVEVSGQERPPTAEAQEQQVETPKAEVPPPQPVEEETPIVLTPTDESVPVQTSSLTTPALRIAGERVRDRARLARLPKVEVGGKAA